VAPVALRCAAMAPLMRLRRVMMLTVLLMAGPAVGHRHGIALEATMEAVVAEGHADRGAGNRLTGMFGAKRSTRHGARKPASTPRCSARLIERSSSALSASPRKTTEDVRIMVCVQSLLQRLSDHVGDLLKISVAGVASKRIEMARQLRRLRLPGMCRKLDAGTAEMSESPRMAEVMQSKNYLTTCVPLLHSLLLSAMDPSVLDFATGSDTEGVFAQARKVIARIGDVVPGLEERLLDVGRNSDNGLLLDICHYSRIAYCLALAESGEFESSLVAVDVLMSVFGEKCYGKPLIGICLRIHDAALRVCLDKHAGKEPITKICNTWLSMLPGDIGHGSKFATLFDGDNVSSEVGTEFAELDQGLLSD